MAIPKPSMRSDKIKVAEKNEYGRSRTKP